VPPESACDNYSANPDPNRLDKPTREKIAATTY
jgi:hypothetical protein